MGPYECRTVLKQGDTKINGPHQGAWIDTVMGQDWFIHFQDINAAGRIIHLQPIIWENEWPIIGNRKLNDIYGEPVSVHKKPDVGYVNTIICEPDNSDEFESEKLGLQWQWNANYEKNWYSLVPEKSIINLYSVNANKKRNLCDYRNLLLQKWPAPEFTCETKMNVENMLTGDIAGIVSLGKIFGGLALRKTEEGYEIVKITGEQEFDNNASFSSQKESVIKFNNNVLKTNSFNVFFHYEVKVKEYIDKIDRLDWQNKEVWLRNLPKEEIKMTMSIGNKVIPESDISFEATPGRWVGVKNGIFCSHTNSKNSEGFVSVDYVRYSND